MAAFALIFLLGIFGAFYIMLRDRTEITNNSPVIAPIRYNIGVRGIPDKLDPSWDKKEMKEFMDQAKNKKHLVVDYTSLVHGMMPETQNHVNKTNGWESDLESQSYFNVTGPVVVRLGLYGNKNPSGISINGRLSKNSDEWWKGINNIFFGIGDGGKRLYIDAKNNDSAPLVLLDRTFAKKIDGVYLMFNEKGTHLLVMDLDFNKIVFIDINQATKNRFPDGLFPDKRFYIGYNIAPLSDLTISNLSIL